jgi:hypothetical protein
MCRNAVVTGEKEAWQALETLVCRPELCRTNKSSKMNHAGSANKLAAESNLDLRFVISIRSAAFLTARAVNAFKTVGVLVDSSVSSTSASTARNIFSNCVRVNLIGTSNVWI